MFIDFKECAIHVACLLRATIQLQRDLFKISTIFFANAISDEASPSEQLPSLSGVLVFDLGAGREATSGAAAIEDIEAYIIIIIMTKLIKIIIIL